MSSARDASSAPAAAPSSPAASSSTAAAAAAAGPENAIRVEEIYDECSELLENDKMRLTNNVLSRFSLPDVLRNQAVAASYT